MEQQHVRSELDYIFDLWDIMAGKCASKRGGHRSGDDTAMKKDLAIYLAILAAALGVQYSVELYFATRLALATSPVTPWILDIVWYALLGAVAAMALKLRRIWSRMLLLAFIPALPHVMFEITHGSDPAYPYIGLFMIIPDLLWTAIGAGIAAVFLHRQSVRVQ